tara:strand:- start:617 stop:1621 length:1005 start_codon:yes stop_codon:yes gene_type:complete
MSKHTTDIVIIGAGPVGLFAIFEAGMLNMKCHVVDALDFAGGQCTALYPEKPIYDIPAYPQIEAAALIEKLEEQAAPFEPTYHLGQQVVELTKAGEQWTVTTNTGTEITAKAVVIAAGCGAFGPNRPPLEGLEEYEGTSVFYMVRSKESLRGKKVVIAGGGDSALDWGMLLPDVAEHVYMVHRRPKFRGAPDSVSKVRSLGESGDIEMVIPYQLDSLEGQGGKLSAVNVKDLDGNIKRLEADVLLPFFGLAMELGPIAKWGLNLEQNLIEVDHATCATSKDGIYAIGDINHYNGKLKLILAGFAEAAKAMHAIYPKVHDAPLHFEYSTTHGVPK